MRVLIMGGTHFVGRALAEYAVSLGDEVTLVNRGNQPAPGGVRSVVADRRTPGSVSAALADQGEWDLAFDAWSFEPLVIAQACSTLAERVGHFSYVSTRSVYQWPPKSGGDEWAPVVDGDPDSPEHGDYAADKRGGEFAAIRAFPGRCLVARPGLILGPWELVGRLPYWLERAARGGEILAPGTPGRPLQYIDVRDLARFVRDRAGEGASDIFDTVSRPGHASMGDVIAATDTTVPAGDRRFTWVEEEFLTDREITGWSDLPIWAPQVGEIEGLHSGNVDKAYGAGLTCRPFIDTCQDTWSWLSASGPVAGKVRREGYLSPEREAEILAQWAARR